MPHRNPHILEAGGSERAEIGGLDAKLLADEECIVTSSFTPRAALEGKVIKASFPRR